MAKDFAFFDTIKQRVDLEEYLEKYCDVELVPDGPGRSRACCPFHEEDTPSFKVQEGQKGYKTWRCYGACGTFGSVIDAVMQKEGVEAWEAAQYLNEEFELGLEMNSEGYQKAQVMIAENKQKIAAARENLEAGESREAKAAQAYLARRGYNRETIEHFKLGIDTSMTKTGRISIPLIDKANHEVSVDGRALYDGAKCRSCGEWVTAREVSKRKHKFEVMTEKGTAARKKLEEAVAKHGAGSVEAIAAQEQVDKYPLPEEDWRACPYCHACGEKGAEAGISWLISQDPKYRFVRDFDKSQFLYHEYETRKALNEDAKLYRQTNHRQLYGIFLVEGYADCWAGWQAGQWAIDSYNGQSLSEWQAAEICELAEQFGVPVILVPDYDTTGFRNVENNIAMLRKFKNDLEIQVLFGVNELTYTDDKGEEKTCKDLGDVLQYVGTEAVAKVLTEGRRPAEEWQIRRILEAKLKNGDPAFSKQEQMNRIAGILSNVRHRQALDHLIPVLADEWRIRDIEVRGWFYANLSEETTVSHGHMFKDINQAQAEAKDFHLHAKLLPTGFEWIDKAVGGGVRRGWLSMLLGKSGTGKALSLDAQLLTPTGWTQMRDVKVGDELIDPATGGSTRVTGVYPQGLRDLYRVKFSDGSSVECDREHLWKVLDSNKNWKVKTLGEIIERIDLSKSPHMIPVTAPVEFRREQPLPIDPYLLGVLLGDACLTNSNPILSCEDPSIIEEINARLPDGIKARKVQGNNCDWGLTSGKKGASNPLTLALRDLGVMGAGLTAEHKFVPALFKFASVTDRLELLRGLMDTDGSVSKQSTSGTGNRGPSVNVEFCTASPQLAEDVVFLVRSLGGTARIAVGKSGYRDKGGSHVECLPRHRVTISMRPDMNPFKTPLKAPLYVRTMNPSRRMTSIEFSRKAEAQCISVDSSDKLYITDDFIVTHNTMLSTQMLANFSQHGTRSIIFSLEQKAGQLFERIASQVLEVPMAEVKQMVLSDDPELEKVRELYKNVYIVDNVPTETNPAINMTPEHIEAMVREINMTHFEGAPADIVIIDHLGILKVPESAPRAIRSDPLQAAGYIMEEMFAVCKAIDVFMVVLQQLPKEIKSGVEFEFDAGRGGSAQTDFCDLIFCVWRPEQEAGLEDAEKMSRSGQYKLKLAKNRYGSDVIEHLYFDKSCLRIIAADKVIMPLTDISDEPRVDVPGAVDGEVITVGADETAIAADGTAPADTGPASELFGEDEVGKTFVVPEPTNDTKTVAESLGLASEEDDDDDSFISWLDS